MPLIIFRYNDPEFLDLSPEIIGFDSLPTTVVIIQETITDIIGFRDNPLPNESSDNLIVWGDGSYIWYGIDIVAVEWDTGFFEVRSIGDYRILTYCLNDIFVLNDSNNLKIPISDSEVDEWNRLIFWNSYYEYCNDLTDFTLSNNLRDTFGFLDTLIHFIDLDSSETDCWNYEIIWDNDIVFS